jgi:hypothetical protein
MKNTGAAAMNTTITMTWADYGNRFRQDSQMHMGSGARAMNMNSWSIYDGKAMYVAVPGQDRRVLRMKVPKNFLSQITTGGMGGLGVNSQATKVVGRGTVLGKPCEIRVSSANTAYGSTKAKIWMWQGLPLRTEMAMTFKKAKGKPARGQMANMPPMNIATVATQLNTNVRPAATLFRLPSGYTVQDMGDFNKMMQQQRRR